MHPQAIFLAEVSEPLLPIITFAEPGWVRDPASGYLVTDFASRPSANRLPAGRLPANVL